MRRRQHNIVSMSLRRRYAPVALLALGATLTLTGTALATTKSRTTTWYLPSTGATTPTSQRLPAGTVSMTMTYRKRILTAVSAQWSSKDSLQGTHIDVDFTRKKTTYRILQGATTDGPATSGHEIWTGSFGTPGKGTVCATLRSRTDSPHTVCITF